MQVLKEKREIILKNDLEKVKLILAKPAFAKAVPLGEYAIHKRSTYNVLMPTRDEPSSSKGKRPVIDVVEIQDSPKRQRVGKEIQIGEALYSPSQFMWERTRSSRATVAIRKSWGNCPHL